MLQRRSARTVARFGVATVLALLGVPSAHSAAASLDVDAGVRPARIPVLPDASPTDGLASRAADAPVAPIDRWQLADGVARLAARHWIASRGAYGGTGNLSVRANAMYLELHAQAALEAHDGAARSDERARGLVRFLTTPPVLVRRTRVKRSSAVFPHAPAFESVYTRQSSRASLHPSADAIVARALLAAWSARTALALTEGELRLIRHAVGAVARGWFYRDGHRAANQINWNADVLYADAVINGRASSLAKYRTQLVWFAQRMRQPVKRGGSTNVTAGGALRYDPALPPSAPINAQGTGEYENLVHGALAYYRGAVRSGMKPLSATVRGRMERWSQQVVLGTWTQSGYLNWDTALGSKRRHLRQYWGFALDSVLRSAGPDGFVGSPQQRAFIRLVGRRGVELFARTAWDGAGQLPRATSFGAPNGFPEGSGNDVMAPLRFALIAVQLDAKLPGLAEADPGLLVSHDSETGRLALSSRRYNLAIVRAGPGLEGGLEPTRLFDGRQRPLTVLGADGLVGPAPDMRLLREGKVLAATQPGHTHKLRARFFGVPVAVRNRSAARPVASAAGTTSSGLDRVAVLHRFTLGRIQTRYVVGRKRATRVVLRLPVWGDHAEIRFAQGVRVATGGWRTDGGTLEVHAQTTAGAAMTVRYLGLPDGAQVRIVASARNGRAPAGTRTVVITAPAQKVKSVTRMIEVAATA